MRTIQGKEKTVRDLLSQKYAIDYYQRDYKWEAKQVQELIEDLTSAFLEDYRSEHPRKQVRDYGRYFLGSVIVSVKNNYNYIVDGQQRLTSLTLFLLMLRNRQGDRLDRVQLDNLIFSEQYGEKSFNLDVDDRQYAMEALFDGKLPEVDAAGESVQNLVHRYQDFIENFPEEIDDKALPYFVDWLVENVDLVQITAYSDEDAYTIFETMNDRGLSLSPTEMLKGYVLSSITDSTARTKANHLWKQRTQELRELGKDNEPDFFKAWLRSQYAATIRERRKGAKPGDFDRIGTEYHRWVREHSNDKHEDLLVLSGSDDFFQFVERDLRFYSRVYQRIIEASRKPVSGWEPILYNAWQGFTLQYMPLLAPLSPDDDEQTVLQKVRLVGTYLDILLSRRVWNFHRNTYSSMSYGMFVLSRELRGLDVPALAAKLSESYADEVAREEYGLDLISWLSMHSQNRWLLHLLLARLADYVETESGNKSRYLEFVGSTGVNRFEVEHIWANHPEQFVDDFPQAEQFLSYRNRIGGLLLLPKRFNASYGDAPYATKIKHYYKENLLAASLNPQCYEHNPGFLQFVKRSGLPFRPHETFTKADQDERGALYREIANLIWNPALLSVDELTG